MSLLQANPADFETDLCASGRQNLADEHPSRDLRMKMSSERKTSLKPKNQGPVNKFLFFPNSQFYGNS